MALGSNLTIPPAAALNAAAAPRALAAAGARSLVPLTYGLDRQSGLILNVLPKAGAPNTLLVQVLWGHALHAVDTPRLNDQELPVGSTISHYTGSQTTLDTQLVDAFAAQAITYTDTLNGFAYSVLAMPTRAFDGQLNLSARLWGRRVYDPRLDSTAGGSGSHRLATPATWSWSDNPSLCTADWLASTLYGAGETVDWTSVPAAAAANDALVGGEKRRIVGVTFSRAGVTGAAVGETLRSYAGCWLVPGGNGVRLVPDADGAAVATYDHAAGQIARLESVSLRDLGDAPTVVEVTYTDTANIPWREATAQAAVAGAGSTVPWRLSGAAMPGVQRYSQANREAIERLNKLRLGDMSFELEVFDIGLRHERGDIVEVSHPIGLVAKPFRVSDVEMTSHGRWVLQLSEHDPAAYSDVVASGPSIADTPRVLPAGPMGDVTLFTASVQSGRITWQWNPATDIDYVATELRETDDEWTAVAPPPVYRGSATSFEQAVESAGTYTLFARHVGRSGNVSNTAEEASIIVTTADLATAIYTIEFRNDDGVFYSNIT